VARSTETAAPLVPARPTLRSLREAAASCRACPLWKTGTQTVFGEGAADAAVMLWIGRGKRRIHHKPSWSEIAACRPWLEAELAVVRPQVLVCLGATAAQALLGRDFRVTRQRGQLVETPLAPRALATVHPPRSCAPMTTSARPSTPPL
jgi:uracil-DNA glycosylase